MKELRLVVSIAFVFLPTSSSYCISTWCCISIQKQWRHLCWKIKRSLDTWEIIVVVKEVSVRRSITLTGD